MITSPDNPRIKYVKSLGLRKTREKEKKYAIEGVHLVGEALKQSRADKDFKVGPVIFSKSAVKVPEGERLLNEIIKSGIEVIEVAEKVMADISDVETPQGIVAVVDIKENNVDDLVREKDPLVVVCAGVQDPGNMGTIIRTADAFGAAGVLYGSGSVDVYNPKTVRSSMGSIFHLPVVHFEDVKVAFKRLKESGVKLVATSLKPSSDLFKIDFKGGTAIVLGGEGAGLPNEVEKLCDVSVTIPMAGEAESLNVAVAGSVILYEAMRQRTRNA